MHVMVLGLRGFPGIQGGVETHAEHLYPKLRDLGCDIEILVRSPYWSHSKRGVPGIRFKSLWSPSSNGAEAFVHSLLGVLYAGWRRPDVLHIHAIGPALFSPLAKLLGLKVVVTHHGPDYDREKWNRIAKAVLRLGERMGMQFANERIAISQTIRQLVKRKFGCESQCIPNGVAIPEEAQECGAIAEFGFQPDRYVLTVSRIVPEKRHLDLISAFSRAELKDWKLALVGDLAANDEYVRKVIAMAADNPNVVLTGFQTGDTLRQLYANAGVFALPSTHEGLPIALLEALSFGLPAIASDIPANLEVGLPDNQYFPVGDVSCLSSRLRTIALKKRDSDYRDSVREWVHSKYDWDAIAQSTLNVYQSICNPRSDGPLRGSKAQSLDT